jgi:hypothetical protein
MQFQKVLLLLCFLGSLWAQSQAGYSTQQLNDVLEYVEIKKRVIGQIRSKVLKNKQKYDRMSPAELEQWVFKVSQLYLKGHMSRIGTISKRKSLENDLRRHMIEGPHFETGSAKSGLNQPLVAITRLYRINNQSSR